MLRVTSQLRLDRTCIWVKLAWFSSFCHKEMGQRCSRLTANKSNTHTYKHSSSWRSLLCVFFFKEYLQLFALTVKQWWDTLQRQPSQNWRLLLITNTHKIPHLLHTLRLQPPHPPPLSVSVTIRSFNLLTRKKTKFHIFLKKRKRTPWRLYKWGLDKMPNVACNTSSFLKSKCKYVRTVEVWVEAS